VKVAQLLDASALLAVAFNEDGAEQVMLALSRPQVGITVANLTEVVSKLRQRGMTMAGCRAFIEDLQLIVVSADTETALLAGELHAQTRWAGLSLGDATCLATAVQHGATVVTADRAWGRLGVGVGISVVR
jgi:PIN domain nuclease of toxin-antitoxin system